MGKPSSSSAGRPHPAHQPLVYDEDKRWLFLIEAVTSHGPVSAKRWIELEHMLESCKVGRVYVTAFPDRHVFRKFASDIAWETEVWIADNPDHMIHFNGDRFLGPHHPKTNTSPKVMKPTIIIVAGFDSSLGSLPCLIALSRSW